MFNVKLHRPATCQALLAREIADRSIAAAIESLGPRLDTMSGAELRGYVRAHTFPQVHDEALKLVGREWPVNAFNELVASALQQATHLVLSRLDTPPVVAVPVPHVRLQSAA